MSVKHQLTHTQKKKIKNTKVDLTGTNVDGLRDH